MTDTARVRSTFMPSQSAEALLAESASDGAFATTLAKGLVVLEAFEGGGLLGNMEISVRTGIPRPTVARLTHTLAELGYLNHDARVAKYAVGGRALRMLHPLLAGMPFRQLARPLMQDLAYSVRGTVSIGLLDGPSVVYVETARLGDVGPHTPDIGMPIPVVRTAMGRAAASTLPEAEAERLDRQLEAADGAMWASHRDLYRDGLRQCAERQFCTCFGDYLPAIHAVAAPLFRQRDRSFAINCGIPAFRLQPGQLEDEIGPRVRALAESIRALGVDPEPAAPRVRPAKTNTR
ncbi:transcriptional regulator, IclR family [Rhodopseudomonas palustris TIE-1]|uniref:IclR family transcriptional regulator n=1 Tax=Rhodopseudomonas palustris TaxID=1076 RepID=UPI000164AC1F|nr:IclR family transcriptional regulator [Rhodopseudomonas palustris]ACE99311.1 transcriptional regulator, IclR family [Rhodopseudomonas palustris TIE-1]